MEQTDKPTISADMDGNIFVVVGAASRALKRAGLAEKADELKERINNEAGDYEAALRIVMEYVDFE